MLTGISGSKIVRSAATTLSRTCASGPRCPCASLMFGASLVMVLLRGNRVALAFARRENRVPCEGCAFHAAGEFTHTAQHFELSELRVRRSLCFCHHVLKIAEEVFHVASLAAPECFGHERGGGH